MDQDNLGRLRAPHLSPSDAAHPGTISLDLYREGKGVYLSLRRPTGHRREGKAPPKEAMREKLDPSRIGEAPSPSDSSVDATLGGYISHHSRPPAFEGSDGHPYTVSPEVEKTPNLAAPFSGYLVFPRWAETGVGIVGHLETPILLEESSREAAEKALGRLTLFEVQALLEAAIRPELHETE